MHIIEQAMYSFVIAGHIYFKLTGKMFLYIFFSQQCTEGYEYDPIKEVCKGNKIILLIYYTLSDQQLSLCLFSRLSESDSKV